MPLPNPLCFSTQPGRSDRCFTHKFLYYLSHLYKGGMLLHTKLNNSQMYFRDIPIYYHDL